MTQQPRTPLPEHAQVEHLPGKWMTDTCERCRRQSVGQKALLRTLLPDYKFYKFYPEERIR